jgi:tetratricopeptide (TPR) repeat protein
MNRATIEQVAGDFSDAYDDYLAAQDIATLLGNEFLRIQVKVNLLYLLADLGDYEGALKTAAETMERCRAAGQKRLEVRVLLEVGNALIQVGDPLRAEHRLLEARRRLAASGDDLYRNVADIYLADLRLYRGDPEEAAELARRAAGAAEEQGLGRNRIRALALLARAESELGELDAALASLDAARGLLDEEPSPDDLWRNWFHRAKVLGKLGRLDESRQAERRAVEGFESVLKRVPERFAESYAGRGEARDLRL